MEFKEITPVRLYESAIEQIIGLVKRSELKPGDKLPPERELAEKLSISRGSLREAFRVLESKCLIRVLESKGLIKSKPGGGRFIREIKKDAFIDTKNVILNLEKSSILELLEAREIFEVKIVKFAAERATAEEVKVIEEAFSKVKVIEEAFSRVSEEGRTEDEKKIESDTEFHLAIARASHNFVFVNIIKLHLDQQIPGRREERWREHQAILQAIKEHDSKKASEAMLKHLRTIRKAIV
jgi:GntR family transcriptional repressor for pyruvate dehydrogenase complex